MRGFADRASYGSYWEPYSLCVDPYWVNQWIKNYAAGFAKRGLVGHLLAGIGGGRVDLIFINIASFALCIVLVYLIAAKLSLMMGLKSWPFAFAWVSLFWMTPFGKSFVETAGDPLQLIIVMWLSISLLFWLYRDYFQSRNWLVDLLVSLLYVVSILVHEGAFLLVFIPFFFLARRTWVWCAGVACAVILIVRFSGSESFQIEHKIADALVAYNPLNGLEMSYRSGGAIASQVSFMDNFWMEYTKYLSSPAQTISDCLTVASLAVVFSTVFRSFCLGCLFRRVDCSGSEALDCILASFVLSMIVSLPFFFVTHDWIRYACVLFALAIAVPSGPSSSGRPWLLRDSPETEGGLGWFARLCRWGPVVSLPDRYAFWYSFAASAGLAALTPRSVNLRMLSVNTPAQFCYLCLLLAIFMILVSVVSRDSPRQRRS